jgi:hypothetical protein
VAALVVMAVRAAGAGAAGVAALVGVFGVDVADAAPVEQEHRFIHAGHRSAPVGGSWSSGTIAQNERPGSTMSQECWIVTGYVG